MGEALRNRVIQIDVLLTRYRVVLGGFLKAKCVISSSLSLFKDFYHLRPVIYLYKYIFIYFRGQVLLFKYYIVDQQILINILQMSCMYIYWISKNFMKKKIVFKRKIFKEEIFIQRSSPIRLSYGFLSTNSPITFYCNEK